MIRYSLRCEQDHSFESWFQNSAAYDSQVKRKLVTCPVCSSTKVEKAIMAPRIVSKKGRDRAAPVEAPAEAPASESTRSCGASIRRPTRRVRDRHPRIIPGARSGAR